MTLINWFTNVNLFFFGNLICQLVLQLDREQLSGQDFAYMCVGALRVSEHTGKTDTCQLVLPKFLWDAVRNYQLLKKGVFGALQRDEALFVTKKGQELSMTTALRSTVAKEMKAVMGLKKQLLPTHQRIVLATRMQQEGCMGDTGMDHQPETQRAIYHNKKAEEGIANKKLVLAKALKAAEENYAPDLNLVHLRDKQDAEHNALSEQWVTDDQTSEEWNVFCNLVQSRQPYKKILSKEKVDLIRSIYAVDDPEWSCLFLAGEGPPACGLRLDCHFERYIMSPGPNMNRIRETLANIAVLIPVNKGLFRKLTHLLLSSFRSLNKSRMSGYCGGPERHPILNLRRPLVQAPSSDEEDVEVKRRRVQPLSSSEEDA